MHALRPRHRDLLWFALGLLLATVVAGLLWGQGTLDSLLLEEALLRRPGFLVAHPQIVAAAQTQWRTQFLASQATAREQLLETRWKPLLDAAFTPSLGNRAAPRLLLEFTDYLCEPCRASAAAVERLVQSNPDVRVAILFLPTQGAPSELLARCALAAYRQNPARFPRLHESLMRSQEPLTQERVMTLAVEAGFDVTQMVDDIGRPETRGMLENMNELARDLNIAGAPAFAMRGSLSMGGSTVERLQQFVAAAVAGLDPVGTITK
jgi:protein-disulfide isomerase